MDNVVENTMKLEKLQETRSYENKVKTSESKKLYLEDDFRCLNYPSFGYVIPNRYCQCGRVRSYYKDKLVNFDLKTDYQLYENDKLIDDVFKVDKGSVYLTKKSLMLNQFLQFADTKTAKVTNNTNRFEGNNREVINSCQSENNNLTLVKVPENKNASRTLSLPSLVISDKRLVSLFRSVALYWFFCLNTVIAKGDLFKRRSLAFDCDSGSDRSFGSNNLKFRISPVVLDRFRDITDDCLCRILMDLVQSENSVPRDNLLLNYAEYPRENMYTEMLQQIFLSVLNIAYRAVCSTDAQNVPPFESSEPCPPNYIGLLTTVDLLPARDEHTDDEIPGPSNRDRTIPFQEDVFGQFDTTLSSTNAEYLLTTNAVQNSSELEKEDEDESEWLVNNAGTFKSTEQCSISLVQYVENKKNLLEKFRKEKVLIRDELVDAEIRSFKSKNKLTLQKEAYTQTEKVNGYKSDDNLEENYYFLPEGIFNVDQNDYPQYNLWCSPLIIEELLITRNSSSSENMRNSSSSENMRNSSSSENQLEKNEETNTTPFKEYNLWKSSFGPGNQIPNPVKDEKFSIFSKSHNQNENPDPNQNQNPDPNPNQNSNPNSNPNPNPNVKPKAKRVSKKEISAYNLWGSPNIIEFLPGIGCSQVAIESVSTQNNSTNSVNSFFSEPESSYVSLKLRKYNNHFTRSRFLNFKPRTNGFASFTDRGAFQYYEKLDEKKEPRHFSANQTPVKPKQIIFLDETDHEVNRINEAAEAAANSSEVACFFKPILPAFEVGLEKQPELKRSSSGSYYLKNRKFFTYSHELDYLYLDETSFKPKYEVSTNDKACQTDYFPNNPDAQFDMWYDNGMYMHSRSFNQRNLLPEAVNPSSDEALYFNLEEMLNYLERSIIAGLGKYSISYTPLFHTENNNYYNFSKKCITVRYKMPLCDMKA